MSHHNARPSNNHISHGAMGHPGMRPGRPHPGHGHGGPINRPIRPHPGHGHGPYPGRPIRPHPGHPHHHNNWNNWPNQNWNSGWNNGVTVLPWRPDYCNNTVNNVWPWIEDRPECIRPSPYTDVRPLPAYINNAYFGADATYDPSYYPGNY